ncbi:hypothetical protein J6590_082025 [Homalodisca vitripennis]|nr:hypothetical protein J6590_082025 [Homalodisca vitripennis]
MRSVAHDPRASPRYARKKSSLRTNIFALQDGPHGFPDEIIPEGMTRQRREYLHKNIRQYCKEEFKDTLCPPVEPEQATEAMAAAYPEPDNPAAVLGPSKKRRKRSV